MSEKNSNSDKPSKTRAEAVPPGPENQKQRWMKYGANVALASVVVILLGVIFVALAQQSWAKLHVDTTELGLYSLKPQTKAVLGGLKKDVRIVSLYSQVEPPPGKEKEHVDYATPVADLLGEYERYGGGKVTTEVIDPAKDPAKVEALIADVTKRYANEVAQYAAFFDGYRKRDEALQKLVAEDQAKAAAIDKAELGKSEAGQLVALAQATLKRFNTAFKDVNDDVTLKLGETPPDYKAAESLVRQLMTQLSGFAADMGERFADTKADMGASPALGAYANESPARFAEIKKQADAVVADMDKLGELKLDALVQTLQVKDGIVVLGPNDMRVLSFNEVWQLDPNARRMAEAVAEGKQIKRRFAGEQQIRAAVLELTQDKKPKVAFVRAGGQPLAAGPSPFGGPSGPFSEVAARLRQYNFEVLEKDLSGQWQAQPPRPGMPPMGPDEPPMEAIKDAVWIVLAMPGGGGGNPSMGPKVADHLKAGGSALVLTMADGEDLSAALTEWGVRTRTDAAIVHEPVTGEGGPAGDLINEAQKNPSIFIVNEFGSHVLAEPVRSLDMPLVRAAPVQTSPAAGVTHWNLVPVPADPKSWGETKLAQAQGAADITFDDGDIAGPLFAGVAAEKTGAGRLVVLGSIPSFVDENLTLPDYELLRQNGWLTARFPGSGELFNNSVFWLAKMEPMIAVSPAAMDVSRIEQMGPKAQQFWRNFVLLAGLPLLVVVAGGLMYMRRRD